jgi:hypothetical protein
MVCQWFDLKTTGMVFSGLASKPMATVSPSLAPKPVASGFPIWALNWQLQFGELGLKITATVSWFGPENQAGFGLSVVPQNPRREDSMGHGSRAGGLILLEASRARVSQSGLKTGGGETAGGACGTIAEVASGSS